jgi:hypothetical protein
VKTVLLPAQNRKELVSTCLKELFCSTTNASCSAKDLPQEVKDGLEIIHVRYVVDVSHVTKTNNITGIYGRLCVTSGLSPAGQGKQISLVLKVGYDADTFPRFT